MGEIIMPEPVINSLKSVLSCIILLFLTSCTLENRLTFHAPNTVNPVLLGPVDRIEGKADDCVKETLSEDVLINGSIVHSTLVTGARLNEEETTTIKDDISQVNLNIIAKTKNDKNKNIYLTEIDISYYSAFFGLGYSEDNTLDYTGFVSDANAGTNK